MYGARCAGWASACAITGFDVIYEARVLLEQQSAREQRCVTKTYSHRKHPE
jgi:hypothetical protein